MDEMLEPIIENLTGGIGKNLSKAGDKLTTGALDRLNAEQKAISDGKIAIANEITRQIVDQIVVPEEYAKRALAKYGEKIVREQSIIDKIFGRSQKILQDTPQDKYEANRKVEEISDDWLNEFRDVACKKSSEEVQELFSKVLAGEIRKPGSFSLKALTTLADMDQTVAIYFNAFCSMSLVLLDDPKMYHITHSKSHFKIKDARVPIIKNNLYDDSIAVGPRYRNNFLKAVEDSKNIYLMYGLRFEHFNLLMEHNLIVDQTSINSTTFWYNNEHWGVLSPDAYTPPNDTCYRPIKLIGYALTNVGKELYHIVDFKTPPKYWERISKFLKDYYNVNLYKYPNPPKKLSPAVSTPQTTPDKND